MRQHRIYSFLNNNGNINNNNNSNNNNGNDNNDDKNYISNKSQQTYTYENRRGNNKSKLKAHTKSS